MPTKKKTRTIENRNYEEDKMESHIDKFLKPKELSIDPDSPTAEREWKHWKKTFENFLEGTTTKDKMKILVNFLSPALYEIVESYTSYEETISMLEDMFVKPKNEIYGQNSSRHAPSVISVIIEDIDSNFF